MATAICDHPLALHIGIGDQGTSTYMLELRVPCQTMTFCQSFLSSRFSLPKMQLGPQNLLSEPSSRALPSLTSLHLSTSHACSYLIPFLNLPLTGSQFGNKYHGLAAAESFILCQWYQGLYQYLQCWYSRKRRKFQAMLLF